MKNINYMINVLMDIMENEGLDFERIDIDDGGASEEAEIHYHLNCPYFSGDERGLCQDGIEPCREQCVNCKMQWLLNEVDV